MAKTGSISPNIGVNTPSPQLRVEISNAFNRLDGLISRYPLILSGQNGPTGNSGSAETDLLSMRIDTGTLNSIGSSLLIHAAGTTAGNGNNKTLKLYFGSTVMFTSGAIALNNKDWTFQAEIVRSGGAAQISWGQFLSNGASPVVDTNTATEDLTQNKTLKLTGTGTASADINVYYLKVVLLN